MAAEQYLVLCHDGEWKITFNGKQYGPYESQEDAIEAAVEAAYAMGEIGIEAARNATLKAFATMPDKHFVVEDLFAEGDKVALRVAIIGGELEPGQRQPIIMEIFRIANGRVAEIWGAGGVRLPDV